MSIRKSDYLKQENHKRILNYIRLQKEISGAGLAKIVQTQRSTLAYILQVLQKREFISISRIGETTTSGGKPPTLWQINKSYGYFVGIEFHSDLLRLSIIDFSLHVIFSQEIDAGIDVLKETGLLEMRDVINCCIKKAKLKKEKIIGISIALPGIISPDNSIVLYSHSIKMNHYNLPERLSELLSIPVQVINDANAGALSTRWFSSTKVKQCKNIVYLSINEKFTGIGSGLVLNGSLYTGWKGTSGEIVPHLNDLSNLIIEGENVIEPENILLDISRSISPSLSSISSAFKKGCKLAEYIINQITIVVKREMLKIIELLNPEQLVIGGDYLEAVDLVINPLISSIEEELKLFFPAVAILPDIIISPLKEYSMAIGSAALYIENYFMF